MTNKVPAFRIYIAGPMTGYPALNFPAFFRMEQLLLKAGYAFRNPARINPSKTPHLSEQAYWQECMKRDIAQLVQCDTIILLKGYENSKGAMIEYNLAKELGLIALTEEYAIKHLELDTESKK